MKTYITLNIFKILNHTFKKKEKNLLTLIEKL